MALHKIVQQVHDCELLLIINKDIPEIITSKMFFERNDTRSKILLHVRLKQIYSDDTLFRTVWFALIEDM